MCISALRLMNCALGGREPATTAICLRYLARAQSARKAWRKARMVGTGDAISILSHNVLRSEPE